MEAALIEYAVWRFAQSSMLAVVTKDGREIKMVLMKKLPCGEWCYEDW